MTLPPSVQCRTVADPAALHVAVDAVVGDARVAALGENNHGIRQFGVLREQLVRFLVRERGFGVVALESGFAEGALVDAWVQGGDASWEDVARDGFTFRAGDHPETAALVAGLREHRAAGGVVRFAGLDVPGSGGSPAPALRRLRAELPAELASGVTAEVAFGPAAEPAAGPAAGQTAELAAGLAAGPAAWLTEAVDRALAATAPYAAANNGVAPGRWSALDAATQDAATTALARLLLRVEALGEGHDVARHLVRGALRLDEQLREFAVLFAGDPPARVVSSRDVHMAETVRLLLAEHPDRRIVLLLHNGHAQRVPFAFLPGVAAPSAGTFLAAELGDDYAVLGITALAGTTTGLALDDSARHGIALSTGPLPDPAPDSVERAVLDAGLGAEPVLLDLRAARGDTGPASIRHATTHTAVDVAAGYDAVICLPEQGTSL
ncbi:erythromycin esterase family protein [Actinomycetospora straminea]|uniref:Erythromycin esterase family protein n=1 Tax=Actinomycetospora straminea TaxID=663607 RepID=A0ABP9E5Z8_9PSEU|nr:erythromycin esterase family protein [Actinomycetospora straminea]MDD7930982.1 erythromycin esterase family protein [Actinomycetospora straminea]